MTRPFTGGCACGAVRYEVVGEPAAMTACQCRQCQHQSGTGHASYLGFAQASVTLEGTPSHWQATGDGGTVKRSAFCPTCGSFLFWQPLVDGVPGPTISFAMGSVEGASGLRTAHHIFIADKGDYYEIEGGVEQHEGDWG